MADLFGAAGRDLLARLELPEPWRTTLATSLDMVPIPLRDGCGMRCDHSWVPVGLATGGTSPQSGVVQRSSPSSAIPSANGVNPSHPP
jgi:hypothetical protein